jgi:uncharacterized membrane protein
MLLGSNIKRITRMDLRTNQSTEEEARFMEDMITGIVAFIVTAVVGLIILSEFYSAVDTSSGPFSDLFTSVESTVGNVYTLLLVLPIVAVGAVAIRMLSDRLSGNGGR